jgi:hypothetical protein
MADNSTGAFQRILNRRMSLIAGLLAVILLLMLILFFVQWYLITKLSGFAADLMESQLVEKAPEGVDREEIKTTFARVKQAIRGMPLTYLTGKVSLGKVRAAVDFASRANVNQMWTAEEVNTLLKMMNAAVGYKREDK